MNMKEHFGTKPIKQWIDGIEWTKNFQGYTRLQGKEKKEKKDSLGQAASGLLLRALNESCRIFLDYLQKSSHSPFLDVDVLLVSNFKAA